MTHMLKLSVYSRLKRLLTLHDMRGACCAKSIQEANTWKSKKKRQKEVLLKQMLKGASKLKYNERD